MSLIVDDHQTPILPMSFSDVSKKYPLYPSDAPVIKLSRAVALVRYPGPIYSLPMGMGIMRVGVRMLVAIRYHMSIQATTTGVLVGFTTSRCMAATGHLV